MLDQLKPISKAVAATLSGLIVGWLFKHNVIISDQMNDALEIVISGVITGAVVYLAPRNRQV